MANSVVIHVEGAAGARRLRLFDTGPLTVLGLLGSFRNHDPGGALLESEVLGGQRQQLTDAQPGGTEESDCRPVLLGHVRQERGDLLDGEESVALTGVLCPSEGKSPRPSCLAGARASRRSRGCCIGPVSVLSRLRAGHLAVAVFATDPGDSPDDVVVSDLVDRPVKPTDVCADGLPVFGAGVWRGVD